jgi:elongation factor P
MEVLMHEDEAVGVEMPLNVVLEVTQTDPGFKGDTATGGNKPAQLETGLTINVPLFVNTGDKIRVDTRDGTYIERV